MCEAVFIIHNSHLWARNKGNAIRDRGFQVHYIVCVWALAVRNIVMRPCLLPERLTAELCRGNRKLFCLGCQTMGLKL
jgi:hypothetical protein